LTASWGHITPNAPITYLDDCLADTLLHEEIFEMFTGPAKIEDIVKTNIFHDI
jgi:hypothetical protein